MKTQVLLVLLILVAPVFGEEIASPSSNAVQLARLYHQGQTNNSWHIYLHLQETPEKNDPDVMLVAARMYLDQRRTEEGFRLLESVSRKRPSDYLPLFVMGVEMTKLGDRDRAAAVLRESIKRNPTHGPSYLWLATATTIQQERIAALRHVIVLEERESPTAREALQMMRELKADGQLSP
jgi:predicted Zn-dependent protease